MPSFTVFQDPETPPVSPARRPAPTIDLSKVLVPAARSGAGLNGAGAEKENVDPLTGEPIGAGPASAKKRKSPVLSLKLSAPELSISDEPESKKRRALSAPSPTPAARRTPGKGTQRKASSSGSRRVSPMPHIDEEPAIDAPKPLAARVQQALVDSRCYDLTVSPLADVSNAFDTTPSSTTSSPLRTFRDRSAEPECQDYFSFDGFRRAFASPLDSVIPTPTVQSQTNSPKKASKLSRDFTFRSTVSNSKNTHRRALTRSVSAPAGKFALASKTLN